MATYHKQFLKHLQALKPFDKAIFSVAWAGQDESENWFHIAREYTEKFKTPMIFAVNKLDDDNADYEKTVRDAKSHFGNNVVVVQYPLQTGSGFHEIIDVLRMTLYRFNDTGGKPEKLPIPESEKEKAMMMSKIFFIQLHLSSKI